ncbi:MULTISPECIES: hypothetical protein [unclassified Nocardiopsis]|uniref:hypothetical protein n=1 Tax=unclassified Nocardiopsis TaxID=2649073 RepID=UPI001F16107D|nr:MULTISPECIES: hypothetical protein [unclassified Nocardiopsis]
MRQFSAAPLRRVLNPFTALLTSPDGRHSTTSGRRRRSSRVRRYAPPPPPPEQTDRIPASPAAPAPRLAFPGEQIHADEIALVRPHLAAHEHLRAAEARPPRPPRPRISHEAEPDEVRRAFAQVQERAAAIVLQWREDPQGNTPSGPAPRFGAVRGPAPRALRSR